jgi:hypothetical protein
MISMPMVYLAQIMHLSCTEINTISKWTEMSFLLTHVTYEYHRVHPKLFLSLLFIWRKRATILLKALVWFWIIDET